MEENNYSDSSQAPVGGTPTPSSPQAPDTVVEDRIFAALSYVSILFIVPLILKNENEDIHFHAKQGLVLFGAEVAVWFVLLLLDSFLAALFPAGELFLIRILGAHTCLASLLEGRYPTSLITRSYCA